MSKVAATLFALPQSLLHAFDTNDRINQYLLENLPAEAWRTEPPGGKGRTIAAIVAHMHNVRVMWLKTAAKGSQIPEQLDRSTVTPAQAAKGLEQSRAALSAVLQSSLEGDGRVRGFRPDVAGFFGYLIAHDAHHRGPDLHAGSPDASSFAAESDVWHVGVGHAIQTITTVESK